jgi:hypothetical protein
VRLGAAERLAQTVGDQPVFGHAQPLEAQWRACTVPKEAFTTLPIRTRNHHACVHVETAVVPAAALGLARLGQFPERIALGRVGAIGQARELADPERALEASIERLELLGFVAEERLVGIAQELPPSKPPLDPDADVARNVTEVVMPGPRQSMKLRSSRRRAAREHAVRHGQVIVE